MEVYILDSLYRRNAVVDRFESLIWTDRWRDVGDFELLIPSTPISRSLFTPNVNLALNESKHVMVVETIEDNTDADGRTLLKVKGRSLEKILDERIARPGTSNTTNAPTWDFTGKPKAIAEEMFNAICVAGTVNAGDVIPLLATGSQYPVENIPFSNQTITWKQDPATLLSALKDICNMYDMGFRLYRHADDGKLYFNIYTGNLRITSQTQLPAVIFTPALQTLQNTTRLMTIEQAKNVAYVVNEQGFVTVYAEEVDPAVKGFERRALTVTPAKLTLQDPEGNSIEPTPTEINNYLINAGRQELSKNRALLAFDGEINQRSTYRYGRDYELGDIIEMRDDDGIGNSMRVTEQIFVHDTEGERSYPTLTINDFIVPGTWNSYLGNRPWADFGATEFWNTMP